MIDIKLIHPAAKVPERKTAGATGYDLYAAEGDTIFAGQWRCIDLGFALAIPHGHEAQIRPRSGLALNYGVTVLNSPGTIDSDYRGRVGVILINHGVQPFEFCAGDRIGQIVIPEGMWFRVVDELGETERADGGFGSTGST